MADRDWSWGNWAGASFELRVEIAAYEVGRALVFLLRAPFLTIWLFVQAADKVVLRLVERGLATKWERRALVYGLPAIGIFTWWHWSWLIMHAEEVRSLALAAGVIGAGIGVYVAFQRSKTDRQRQITETFEGAVGLLGHEDRSVRLGAIYALERIARQNKDEHWPIMETLTAYIRERSAARKREAKAALEIASGLTGDEPGVQDRAMACADPAPADILAAFAVLGRRRTEHERTKDEESVKTLNLDDAYLADARPDPMPGRDFSGARFMGAQLARADLRSARFDRALLVGANFEGANLRGAHLEGAILNFARLRGAILQEAHIEGADLKGSEVANRQLESAFGDAATKISNMDTEGRSLERPKHWSKRSRLVSGPGGRGRRSRRG